MQYWKCLILVSASLSTRTIGAMSSVISLGYVKGLVTNEILAHLNNSKGHQMNYFHRNLLYSVGLFFK